jgi:curved DNA-binding protein CbpA
MQVTVNEKQSGLDDRNSIKENHDLYRKEENERQKAYSCGGCMLSASGDIKDMTVPWLFQELKSGKKSGTAIFEQDTVSKKVYFENGEVLFASSTVNDDRLGEFLLRQGRITKEQFDAASGTVIKTKKKLGAVLFELGILTPKDLVAQVKLHVKDIILSLFIWRQGRYRFEEGSARSDDLIPLTMSTGNLILEGVQTLDWQVVRKALPPMKTVIRPSRDPSLIFQMADLSADQKSVLSLIDGGRNIEQICSRAGIGDFNTLKAIYGLLALKIAEVGKLSPEEQRLARDMVCEAAGNPASPDEQCADAPVSRQMIHDAFLAMKHQDHYAILGAHKGSSLQEIKKSFLKLAKRYHPDRHFEPEMADMKEKLDALFSRIHDAYETLSDPARRGEYEKSLGVQPGHYEEKRAEEYVENYVEKAARAASYFAAGIKEFKVGNFWGAADSFAWATRLDPVKAPYFFYLGLSLIHIPRRRHEAEENLQKAIAIDPVKPEYHLELGSLYLKSGLKKKALEVYETALQENPFSEKLIEAVKKAAG